MFSWKSLDCLQTPVLGELYSWNTPIHNSPPCDIGSGAWNQWNHQINGIICASLFLSHVLGWRDCYNTPPSTNNLFVMLCELVWAIFMLMSLYELEQWIAILWHVFFITWHIDACSIELCHTEQSLALQFFSNASCFATLFGWYCW